jgi:hypothetical protein
MTGIGGVAWAGASCGAHYAGCSEQILLVPLADSPRLVRSMVSFAGMTYDFGTAVDNWPAQREGGGRVRQVLARLNRCL